MAAGKHVDRLPPVVPPIARTAIDWNRSQTPAAALSWLAAGWKDLTSRPGSSLVYGTLVFVISFLMIGGLFRFGYDYILFPALSAFLVLGPLIATGLYEKSRRLSRGAPVTLVDMVLVRARSGTQILFIGVLLCMLALLWMRSAVLLYALFFGLLPFPGFADILSILLTTPAGWSLLIIGSLCGGLFAAFAFAVSVFAVPMLLDEDVDALTAMGRSMALVWNNLPVTLSWGAIVVGLFALSLATGLLGLVLVFPLLGHATWHAYSAVYRRIPPGSGQRQQGADGELGGALS